jgi:hypothetical protein
MGMRWARPSPLTGGGGNRRTATGFHTPFRNTTKLTQRGYRQFATFARPLSRTLSDLRHSAVRVKNFLSQWNIAF